jgi:hypothetical protein
MAENAETIERDEKELHVARAIARALAKAATLHGDDHTTIVEHVRKWEGIEFAHAKLPVWLASAARHTYDVDVFLLTGNDSFQPEGWTWCPVIDGDPRDLVYNLPRCANEDDARAKAYEWLSKRYAALAAAASEGDGAR